MAHLEADEICADAAWSRFVLFQLLTHEPDKMTAAASPPETEGEEWDRAAADVLDLEEEWMTDDDGSESDGDGSESDGNGSEAEGMDFGA